MKQKENLSKTTVLGSQLLKEMKTQNWQLSRLLKLEHQSFLAKFSYFCKTHKKTNLSRSSMDQQLYSCHFKQ